jgi:hypothetical protein
MNIRVGNVRSPLPIAQVNVFGSVLILVVCRLGISNGIRVAGSRIFNSVVVLRVGSGVAGTLASRRRSKIATRYPLVFKRFVLIRTSRGVGSRIFARVMLRISS